MQVDTKYLSRHYATLSDQALLEIKRDELVEAAQTCYDQELSRRNLDPSAVPESEEDTELHELGGDQQEPEWIEDAVLVLGYLVNPGDSITRRLADMKNAHTALRKEAVPCYLYLHEFPREGKTSDQDATHEWRLVVPNRLTYRANSVLEQQIFNLNFEADWKSHLEMLDDSEVEESNPRLVFAGLYDRIERANKAYQEELERRGLGVPDLPR